jgi:hypothetical protein
MLGSRSVNQALNEKIRFVSVRIVIGNREPDLTPPHDSCLLSAL